MLDPNSASPTQEIPKAYDPREAESKWYQHWIAKGYFHAEDSSDKPSYCIVIPPPNITGALHMGHAVFVTVQDILTRWKRMSGFNTLWLPGTDHAGIATQMIVERDLKKTEGKSRHDLGREEFLKRVWAWKQRYGGRIVEQLKVLGASCDWQRERFTMDEGLTKAVREAFVRLYEEGLIYRANRLINWCPRCRTALSDLEVEHEDRAGKLWHIAYPVKGSDKKLIVATTRPETMLGDTAVAVHPDDPRYKDLIGQRAIIPLIGREIPIIADKELVSMEFGTGAVKVTPAHDFNDYAVGQRHGLEQISILDLQARTNENAGSYRGLDRYEARERVVADLEASGALVKTEDYKLSIGTCQRCGDVVEPMLSPQWFVKIETLAKPAIEAVETGKTVFIPEQWTNTYFGWMRNLHDWCISRQLWWGHQIPAWYCDCGEVIVAREEPKSCPKCGSSALRRDEDVLDTWFSSGLWPFSTLGWPERTKALETFYPTTVMETGHDIIFFWVARMMMFGLHFMNDVPFRTVFLHAMVRDEKGEKMSKVKGNVIDPLDVINGQPDPKLLPAELKKKFPKGMPAFGADALRFTLAALTAQGRDIKLSLERVDGYRAFANKIWNASRFVLMNLGAPEAVVERLKTPLQQQKLTLADRWILSRLDRTIADATSQLEAFKFNDAANTLYQFIWGELCDWYIELCKGRLYGSDEEAKGVARAVLVYVLDQALKLLHPFMPYITEEIWQRLPRREGDPQSIMVAPYPASVAGLRDEAAEREMATVIAAIDGIRSIRGESNIAPSRKIAAIVHAGPEVRAVLEKHRGYLEPLAGLEQLTIVAPGPKPKLSATFVDTRMEIFVPLAGIIDLAEEEKRVQREMAKAAADIELLQKKLSNPSFTERAPAEIVQKDKARLAELREKSAKLEQGLARLKEAAPAADEGAKVTIRDESSEGGVDLAKELEGELKQVELPQEPSREVVKHLEKLRESTKQGLSQSDHYDLGVAYMGMGLIEDAAREFKEAGRGAPEELKRAVEAKKAVSESPSSKTAGGKAAKAPAKKPEVKKASEKRPTAKKATAKRPVAKKASEKRPAAKKATAKKPAAKKAVAKKPAAKKAVAKKPAAKKAVAKKPAAKKAVAKKPAAKKTAAQKLVSKKPIAKKTLVAQRKVPSRRGTR